jgi:glycosyltransferase involved in cell wall biosynthesis
VRSDGFAGVERYICGVANELAARGHLIQVIGGDPERMRAELAVGVRHLPAAGSAGVWRGLVRAGAVDLVHVHMTAAELAALAALPAHHAPVVATRHFPDRRLCGLPGPLGGFVAARLRAQISISHFVAREIGEPSVVIHNGVARRGQAELDRPVVLMLQRLQPEKAPGDGLEAWAKSRLGDNGWTLAIAGSGVLDGSLRRLAVDLGVNDSVSFLGHVSATDELLRGAAIFLAPAPAEPFGLSVVEAMAHGVPVIAARGGAHVETLGEEGLFFPGGGTVEAAEHLRLLAGDLELRGTCGARLRDRQQELFTIERHVSSLEELYDSIVTGPS